MISKVVIVEEDGANKPYLVIEQENERGRNDYFIVPVEYLDDKSFNLKDEILKKFF